MGCIFEREPYITQSLRQSIRFVFRLNFCMDKHGPAFLSALAVVAYPLAARYADERFGPNVRAKDPQASTFNGCLQQKQVI